MRKEVMRAFFWARPEYSTVSNQKFPPPYGPGILPGGEIVLGGEFLLRNRAEEDLKGGFLGNGRARGGEPKS